MKWVSRIYRAGDRETRKCFAWVPTRLDAKTIVWLESHWEERVWYSGFDSDGWRTVRRWQDPPEVHGAPDGL